MKLLNRFVRGWDRLLDAIAVVAGVLLWGLMLIVNYEIFSRYLGSPTTWVAEISSILVLWIPFLIAGWVLRNEGHVKMDLLVERLDPKKQAFVNCCTSIVGAAVMIIVTVVGFMTTMYWLGNRTPTMLMLPRSPIIGVIFFGSLLLAVQFILRARANYIQWKEPEELR